MIHICILFGESERMDAFSAALEALPFSLRQTPGAAFLSTQEELPEGIVDSWVTEIGYLAEYWGVPVRLGVADSAFLALAYAHWGPLPREQLPVEALQFLLAPFQTPAAVREIIHSLKRKGIRLLSELQRPAWEAADEIA